MASELWMMGPMPTATSNDIAKKPEALPSTVNTATFLPHAIARAMVKSTEGPGAAMMAMETRMYSPILDGMGIPGNTIIHCFSGGPEEARQCLDRGAYLSFSGIVTFKNASELREAASLCPLDRMLVETDAPFLAPEPHRGKRCEPAYTADTARVLAKALGLPFEDFSARTTANFYRLFSKAAAICPKSLVWAEV